MEGLWLGVGSALYLGILTSISPCPLATNIAAISFVSKRVGSGKHVLATGLLYALGRTVAYLALGGLLAFGLLSVPELSDFLQKSMNRFLGPVLILVGMVVVRLIEIPSVGMSWGKGLQDRAEKWGILGALLLGVLFALSFCPVSAALFFGSLLPLCLRAESSVLLPSLYGIGTALPVLVFSFVLAFAANSAGKVFNRMQQIEGVARNITGVVFILAGIYLSLVYIFGVQI